jgi:hypothetical protein
LRHVVGLIAAVLAGVECTIPAVTIGVLRSLIVRQFVERLITERRVLRDYPAPRFRAKRR